MLAAALNTTAELVLEEEEDELERRETELTRKGGKVYSGVSGSTSGGVVVAEENEII